MMLHVILAHQLVFHRRAPSQPRILRREFHNLVYFGGQVFHVLCGYFDLSLTLGALLLSKLAQARASLSWQLLRGRSALIRLAVLFGPLLPGRISNTARRARGGISGRSRRQAR